MRWAIVAAVFLLAGCASSAPATDPHTTVLPPTPPTLPDDIHDDRKLPPSVDAIATGGPTCSPPSSCVRYPFTVATNATIMADLLWATPSEDYDLYLMQGGAVLNSSKGSLNYREVLRDRLVPGDYEIVVSGSLTAISIDYPYHLDVFFDRPR